MLLQVLQFSISFSLKKGIICINFKYKNRSIEEHTSKSWHWGPVSLWCVGKCSWRYVYQTQYEMSKNKHNHYNEMRTSLFVDDKAINGPTVANDRTNISGDRTDHIFNTDKKGKCSFTLYISERSWKRLYRKIPSKHAAMYGCIHVFCHFPVTFANDFPTYIHKGANP